MVHAQQQNEWEPEYRIGRLLDAFQCKDGLTFIERLRLVRYRMEGSMPADISRMLERHYTAYKASASEIGRSEFSDMRRRVKRILFRDAFLHLGKKEPEVMFIGNILLMLADDHPDRHVFVLKWNDLVQRNYHLPV